MITQGVLENLEENRRISHGSINKYRWKFVRDLAHGTILDLGCAKGGYVSALRELHREAYGVDVLDYSDQWNQLGIQKFCSQTTGNFEELPHDEFDTVLLFEVLEHIDDPDQFLAKIHSITKNMLILSVPDCKHNTMMEYSGVSYNHYTDSSHVNFFDQESLMEIISRNGFQVQSVTSINPINPISLLAHSLYLPPKLCKFFGKLNGLLPRSQHMTILAIATKMQNRSPN